LPIIFHRRKHVNKEKVKCGDNIALIIPCHKAENIMKKTLEEALKVFDAKNIYVIDNGNSDVPLDNTGSVCQEMGISYKWVPVGGKLYAIYVGAKITEQYEFVMQIDDDVFLNDDMTFPVNENTHCIAYTISASNHKGEKQVIHHLQDMEYKHAGIIKGFQSQVGSTMFAHGAISLWRRSTLVNVLEKHIMYSMSDDWFTGFKANELGYKIDVCDRNFVDTDVPSTFFTKSREGGYGDATLFTQRFGRWYRTRLIQIFYLLYYCVFSWKLPLRIAIVQKLFFLWEIFNSLLSFSKIYMFIFYVIYDWRFTMIMFGASIGLSMIGFLIFNYYQLKKDERLPIWVMFLFPVYALYESVVFLMAVLYSIVVNPQVLFHRGEKLSDNEKLKNVINN
jgi:glycosyltransferase involved in cell wall biosynthesis